MINFTYYKNDGSITKNMLLPESYTPDSQASPDEYFIEGNFPGDVFYIDASTQQAVAIPESPSKNHVFDYTSKTWFDPRTMEQRKDAKWQEIKRQRETAEFGGFAWNGHVFDSDLTSQSRIQGAAQLAQIALAQSQPFEIDWTLADNTVVTLDATDMLSVGMTMGTHIATTHAHSRILRAQIESAQTIIELDYIQWSTP